MSSWNADGPDRATTANFPVLVNVHTHTRYAWEKLSFKVKCQEQRRSPPGPLVTFEIGV